MMGVVMNNDNESHARELLLAEHKYLGDSFWKNEEGGETKVRFFITLVAAVLTAIATLFTITIDNEEIDNLIIPIIIFVLFSLLMFGIITLLRILKRNKVADTYKKGMDEIRERFRIYFDDGRVLSGYEPLGAPTKRKRVRKLGGLAHIVSVLNSLILAALSCAIVLEVLSVFSDINLISEHNNFTIAILLFFSICIFFLGFIVHCICIYFVEKKSDDRYTHAGGIVWKMVNNEPQFLIVTAKNNSSDWVLPKGHIEKDEMIEETSVREVKEETGVDARVVGIVGSTKYKTDKEFVHVKFYLMECLREHEHGEHEGREAEWYTFQEAEALLTFSDTKRLLRSAMYRLEKITKG
ncbi:MAG: NUDIX domain-containing protein [Candidatus Scalindua sp. AMX11]|nr:MAG: NUDIX domain-containing protein [Candidatus Scalindua sp.]NOG82495.1 NUDIX domain-containing protein [Planctomycetota bacterium]RZV93927.1 MAG: NUDIX domain-containing protein [Candidatus Scalindua sp. SCAELEC01]TDE65547.1 MAG: NUDIX domain-containing protein [Candidatus Scalindua sp. AMX11]GJQ58131.1 MAG: hypothetical protein SCALA701_09320 [Candidatus Scalindua sp.]